MVARRKPIFDKLVNNKLPPTRVVTPAAFKKNHKRGKGRPKGVPNTIGATLRQIIMTAVEKCGSDGKGKGGAVGYLYRIAVEKPELMVRLLDKMLPAQVVGENGGPLKIVALPPAVLSQLPDNELELMESVFRKVQSGEYGNKESNQRLLADASRYAQVIDVPVTKVEQ